jgi:hypothetical protein
MKPFEIIWSHHAENELDQLITPTPIPDQIASRIPT